MSTEKCDEDIYNNGTLIAVLDACKYRAEMFSVAVAKDSGQRVDWHYAGGRAYVAALGNIDVARASAHEFEMILENTMERKDGECGSCDGDTHRTGRRLDR